MVLYPKDVLVARRARRELELAREQAKITHRVGLSGMIGNAIARVTAAGKRIAAEKARAEFGAERRAREEARQRPPSIARLSSAAIPDSE